MPTSVTDRTVDVFVEIPRGSRAKYELDHKTGHIRLDRVLTGHLHSVVDALAVETVRGVPEVSLG